MAFTITKEIGREVVKYVRFTDLITPKPFPGVGTGAMLQAEKKDIRYRADGINPTVNIGFLLKVDQTITFIGDVSKLRFIATSSGAILNIHILK